MAYGIRAAFGNIRELDYTGISGTYAAVGVPLSDHVRILSFQNSCDQDLYISADGTNNKLRIAANSFKLFDISANKVRDDGMFFPIGMQFYVKEVSASVGSGAFWIEEIHAEGGI